MDNHRGRQLYRFDMSLMERLATAGLPMTQINTQRRMRPMIANLVRYVLLWRQLLDKPNINAQKLFVSETGGPRPCQEVP